jgi:hypothetical protein
MRVEAENGFVQQQVGRIHGERQYKTENRSIAGGKHGYLFSDVQPEAPRQVKRLGRVEIRIKHRRHFERFFYPHPVRVHILLAHHEHLTQRAVVIEYALTVYADLACVWVKAVRYVVHQCRFSCSVIAE